MTIDNFVKVNTNYTRSINLERDLWSSSVVKSYIPTSRAISTLDSIVSRLNAEATPRAWTLIGPYGSGKSSFAIFLSHLLGDPKNKTTALANEILKSQNKEVAKNYHRRVKGSAGFCKVLLTGSPEPFRKRFLINLCSAAEEFLGGKRGRVPNVIKELKKALKRKEIPVPEIINIIKNLQNAITKANGKGLLIVIDELGKFLEYEARHPDINDIYLLQALAEHAYSKSSADIVLIAMLHQTFEQYAKGLSDSQKNEWVKIQGRFESVPYVDNAEQVLRVVAKAIQHKQLKDTRWQVVEKNVGESVKILVNENVLPVSLTNINAKKLFNSCYPVHPVTALVLPILCQKIAQNERTLFSYLGSNEPLGFRSSLVEMKQLGDWVYPWVVFDYFVLNHMSKGSDHYFHRRWAEVAYAIERLGDASEEELKVLKTIGLLNVLGQQGNLKASKKIIRLCLPKNIIAQKTLQKLEGKSIIQFRKFSGEYRVWQGSDFDLDEAVKNEKKQLGPYSLAKALNDRKVLPPLVARKYTIENGALRYFQPFFADSESIKSLSRNPSVPRVIFYLDEATEKQHFQDTYGFLTKQDILVYCSGSHLIKEAVSEVLALNRVASNYQELQSDPVSQRDFKERLSGAEAVEDELLNSYIEEPENKRWYWNGQTLPVKNKRSLQTIISTVLESIYIYSPVFKNELINRDKPSAQANSGRNKLIHAMLHNEAEKNLGIEKFPPEKAIYFSIIKASGIHRIKKGEWGFFKPNFKNDENNLKHVWDRIERFFDKSSSEALTFTSLGKVLSSPPYGVKEGILPILFVSLVLIYKDELAIYENGIYVPYFTEEHLERLTKRPENFKFQFYKIKGVDGELFRRYLDVFDKNVHSPTVISVVKPFARIISNLPDYSKNTKTISNNAKKVVQAFTFSKTPHSLLLSDLPKACGFDNVKLNSKNNKATNEYFETLKRYLSELNNIYSTLLCEMEKVFIEEFSFIQKGISRETLKDNFMVRLPSLKRFSADRQVREFIERVFKNKGNIDSWFESVLSILSGKHPKKWNDSDAEVAKSKVVRMANKINDLYKIEIELHKHGKSSVEDAEIFLLRVIRAGLNQGEIDGAVYIDAHSKNSLKKFKSRIKIILLEMNDQDLELALLAGLAEELMIMKSKSRLAGLKSSTTEDNKHKEAINE